VLEALPIATMLLDTAGIVVGANRAACDLLGVHVRDLVGEPLLAWIRRSSEREGFGRAFMALKDRDPGAGFSLDLRLACTVGPPLRCVVRSSRLADGHVALTFDPAQPAASEPQAELGHAMTRSLDVLDQGVLMVDGEGRVVHANPAAVSLLGEDITGRSFFELASPDSVNALTRALTVARAGSWQGEVDLHRLDGEPLPVELSMAVAAGEGAPGVVLLRDLRERRRRQFEDRLVTQVDRQLLASTEPRESVLSACSALATGFGAERVVVLARLRGGWELWELHGESPKAPMRRRDGWEPPGVWEEERDVHLLSKEEADLALGNIERGRACARVTLRAPTGVVGHLLLVHRRPREWDVRDRALIAMLASQIALGLANGLLTLETRALAAYQAMVLDQTSVMLNSVDADGRLVTWNRASEHLLGVSVADAVGKRFGVDVARVADQQRWNELWQQLLDAGVFASDLTVQAADAGEIPVHMEGRVLREGEQIRGAVLVGIDLRERRTLERQVLRSQKLAAVGLLAAGIAHEINNPLSGVVGYSKLLLERRLPDEIRDQVEKIADSGERCRKIVEGVLLFARGREGGPRKPVELGALLEGVIAIGEYQWRMHNIRIMREVEGPVEVYADADQIEQVLLNLLSNAVDAMPRGGTVRLCLGRRDDGSAELSVIDQGHGIPEDVQARIFDPFFSTKEIGKGTGLGLAISYGIVQEHGGDILLKSRPGEGSSFTVILPPGDKSQVQATPNSHEPPGEGSGGADSHDQLPMETV
jgi:PAS domain S-box-containing protein